MRCHFYDDPILRSPLPVSIFLAGPTAAGVNRTPWRKEAIAWLEAKGFAGTAILPEFRDGFFDERAPVVFGTKIEPERVIPGMRAVSQNILTWETAGIESAAVVLFWMPFALAAPSDPSSLPGFTTRAEVSREIARDPSRVVLGMPAKSLSSGHIRFHAHQAGVTIASTLVDTLEAALKKIATVAVVVVGVIAGMSGMSGMIGCGGGNASPGKSDSKDSRTWPECDTICRQVDALKCDPKAEPTCARDNRCGPLQFECRAATKARLTCMAKKKWSCNAQVGAAVPENDSDCLDIRGTTCEPDEKGHPPPPPPPPKS
jgi:hypothetical protein